MDTQRPLGYREAMGFLKKVKCPSKVIHHSVVVSRVAIEIAEACRRRGVNVDEKLVEVGALLHDVGRSVTHNIDHGVTGGKLARTAGFPECVVKIVENHIGAGIPADEANGIGLPEKDFIPTTIEEKIVTFADKLVVGKKRVESDVAFENLAEALGHDHPALERFKKLRDEIAYLAGVSF